MCIHRKVLQTEEERKRKPKINELDHFNYQFVNYHFKKVEYNIEGYIETSILRGGMGRMLPLERVILEYNS